MQETWILTLPKSKKPRAEEIKQVLTENEKDLGIFLSYYFKKEGALAEQVNCLAIHEQKRDRIKITFEIEDDKLNLKGPYWPEREMDEI